MTKINVPVQVLVRCHRQAQQLGMSGDLMYYVNKSKIHDWMNKNGARCESYMEKFREVDKAFCAPTLDGKDYQKDEQGNPKLLDGKTQEEYESAYHEILKEVTVMEV